VRILVQERRQDLLAEFAALLTDHRLSDIRRLCGVVVVFLCLVSASN
jgi:hypothetical protein